MLEFDDTWRKKLTSTPGAHPAPSLASDDVSLISEGKTQPAQSVKDAIIDDLQSQFDTEGITEHDSGDALIRLSDAIAAVEDNFAQPEPSAPDGWLPIPGKHPTFDPVDLQLSDGSVLCGCVPQSDGDYWWEGPSGEVFIDPKYASVTHWRLAAAPEAKP